jgi:hypothetical protein
VRRYFCALSAGGDADRRYCSDGFAGCWWCLPLAEALCATAAAIAKVSATAMATLIAKVITPISVEPGLNQSIEAAA